MSVRCVSSGAQDRDCKTNPSPAPVSSLQVCNLQPADEPYQSVLSKHASLIPAPTTTEVSDPTAARKGFQVSAGSHLWQKVSWC